MLPQTNLQLYRVLLDRGASDADLARVRAAYDLARRLFVGCYRPSHKPFLCHLCGAAGAAAHWGQDIPVVVAALLHSAYLFGEFGDGARGISAPKQKFVVARVGADAEAMIAAYTRASWTMPLDDLLRMVRAREVDRYCVLLKLADLCDECVDGGPRLSPAKSLAFDVTQDQHAQGRLLELVETLAGAAARAHFASILDSLNASPAPAALVTSDRSFHQIKSGVDELRRSGVGRRLRKIADSFGTRVRAA